MIDLCIFFFNMKMEKNNNNKTFFLWDYDAQQFIYLFI
jgi:hypothetical protein